MATAAARGRNLLARVSVRMCSVQLANVNLVVENFEKEIQTFKDQLEKALSPGTRQDGPVTKFTELI